MEAEKAGADIIAYADTKLGERLEDGDLLKNVQYSQRQISLAEEQDYVKLTPEALDGFEGKLFDDIYSLFHNTDNDMFRKICSDARNGKLESVYEYKTGI